MTTGWHYVVSLECIHQISSNKKANLAVALYGLSVQDSCLMVFTVHGIVLPSCCMYFLGLYPRKYIEPLRGTYPIHCKNHETTITYPGWYIYISPTVDIYPRYIYIPQDIYLYRQWCIYISPVVYIFVR